jgi:hypothetical protein
MSLSQLLPICNALSQHRYCVIFVKNEIQQKVSADYMYTERMELYMTLTDIVH